MVKFSFSNPHRGARDETPGTASLRLPTGGLIDRSKPIRFRFNGRELTGFEGDTPASALWANGVKVAGASARYRRPRPSALSVDLPSALVTIGGGVPIHPAAVPLVEGLEARGGSSHLPARLFWAALMMWPGFRRERRAEPEARPNIGRDLEVRTLETEVLIVGGGASGLREALIAAGTGAEVTLVERSDRLGGSLIDAPETVDGLEAGLWLRTAEASLRRRRNVRILTRTTAIEIRDGAGATIVERLSEGPFVERAWNVRAGRVIVAAGAVERGYAFSGNDKPGVTTVRAARAALARHALTVGRRQLIFTALDEGHEFARRLRKAGVSVAAVVDPRPEGPAAEATRAAGIPVLVGHVVVRALGWNVVRAVEVEELTPDRTETERRPALIDADAVIVGMGLRPDPRLSSSDAIPVGEAAGVPDDGFPPLTRSPGCDEVDAFVDPDLDLTLADLRSAPFRT